MYVENNSSEDVIVRLVTVSNCDGDGYEETSMPIASGDHYSFSPPGLASDFWFMISVTGDPSVLGEVDQSFTSCDCLGYSYPALYTYPYAYIVSAWGLNSAFQCGVIRIED